MIRHKQSTGEDGDLMCLSSVPARAVSL